MTDEERRREELFEQATGGVRQAKAKAEARKRKPKSANGEMPPEPPPVLEEHPEAAAPYWTEFALLTPKGLVMPILANALECLRRHPDFAGLLGYDEFVCRETLLRPMPDAHDKRADYPRPLNDLDLISLQAMLQWRGLPRIGPGTTEEAVSKVAGEHRYHPIRDWLDGLEWDGVLRLARWLHECVGTPDDEYHKQVGTLFLTAMVARVYQPGCKADYVPVLEGDQGTLKSSLCQELAGGDEYFSDHLPSLRMDDVRLSMHLRGKWLIEVSELASFGRGEIEDLKSFLTRREEKYTPKYGRREIREPRQCLFIASTNRDDYNRDETGARRLWPVRSGTIDIGKLREARQQLFAEAVARFKQGKPWWPDRQMETDHFVAEQAERREEDPWTDDVLAFLLPRVRSGATVTISEVLEKALEMKKQQVGKREQNRIIAILKDAGWTRGKRTETGRPWQAPPAN